MSNEGKTKIGLISLNNGNDAVEKFKKQSVKKVFPVLIMGKSATLESPNITDSNIKNNSAFIVNLFGSNSNASKQKKLINKHNNKIYK